MELTISHSGVVHIAKKPDSKIKTYKDLWKVISLIKLYTTVLPMARPRSREEIANRRKIYTQEVNFVLTDMVHFRTANNEIKALLTKWKWKSKKKGRDTLWILPKDKRLSLTVSSPVFVGGGIKLTLKSAWIDPVKEPEKDVTQVNSNIIYSKIDKGEDYEMRKASKLEKERAEKSKQRKSFDLTKKPKKGSKPASILKTREFNKEDIDVSKVKFKKNAEKNEQAAKPDKPVASERKEPQAIKVSNKKLPDNFDELDFNAQLDALLES